MNIEMKKLIFDTVLNLNILQKEETEASAPQDIIGDSPGAILTTMAAMRAPAQMAMNNSNAWGG